MLIKQNVALNKSRLNSYLQICWTIQRLAEMRLFMCSLYKIYWTYGAAGTFNKIVIFESCYVNICYVIIYLYIIHILITHHVSHMFRRNHCFYSEPNLLIGPSSIKGSCPTQFFHQYEVSQRTKTLSKVSYFHDIQTQSFKQIKEKEVLFHWRA